ncbi:MAG: hypothetical protein IT266_08150 [Saprospiraceae bacterium]|nr:hypothetical protein [Saprospiraceae bacterium]
MYPSITYPEYDFKPYTPDFCPFTFLLPSYAVPGKDSTFFEERPENDCWLNIELPDFNGTVYCSYYPLRKPSDLEKYIRDAHKLAREHQKKANYIDELPLVKPNGVYGLIFNIEGPAASPFQFYLTDSSEHFFRASLYFRAQAKPDSLQPVTEFVKKDLMEMINTFSWTHK